MLRFFSLCVSLCVLGVTIGALPDSSERYDELLTIRPLRDGKVFMNFEFRMAATSKTLKSGAYTDIFSPPSLDISFLYAMRGRFRLVPLKLAQLSTHYGVSEMHLNLNAGRWDYSAWGMPESSSVSSGADLWGWLADDAMRGSIEDRWQGLTSALSGVFCASLGSVSEKWTVEPLHTFRPEGVLIQGMPHRLRYAALPSENVCTENLTPFVHMLPCKTKSGIAQLLNPYRLFDADWHGMSIDITSWHDGNLSLKLIVGAVFDPVRRSDPDLLEDWTFMSLFDAKISRQCTVASSSEVHVYPPVNDPFAISPPADGEHQGMSIYDLKKWNSSLNIGIQFQRPEMVYEPLDDISPISIHRVLPGGQSTGHLSVRMHNRDVNPAKLLWMETLPWFITLYLHTMTPIWTGSNGSVRVVNYKPSDNLRHGPALMETAVELPPKTSVLITIDIEKASILYTEHPPDASRGWDIPAAVFTLSSGRRVYSTTLLAELATPDFSMPYNVIIMTSTLVALFFGSIFNILTRSFVWTPK